MPQEKDYSSQDVAVLRKWERDIARNEQTAEHAEDKVKKTLAGLLKENQRNLIREVVKASKNPKVYDSESGASLIEDELITGYDELPWERDD